MLTKEDHAAIAAAIHAAEQRTSAQIVCVLARASSAYALTTMFPALLNTDAIARIKAGFEPQQEPTNFAPASTSSGTCAANCSGVT